jgi:hypothetical protein
MNKLTMEVSRKHYLLRWMNPKDELLKYFFMDEEGAFCMNSSSFDEFVERFNGSKTSIDDFAVKAAEEAKTPDGGIDMDIVRERGAEYGVELFNVVMKKYISALEKEIGKIEEGN